MSDKVNFFLNSFFFGLAENLQLVLKRQFNMLTFCWEGGEKLQNNVEIKQ